MRKQMKECRTPNQIRERLKRSAGIIKEDFDGVSGKEDLIELEGITKGELMNMVHQAVKDYFDETFDTSPMEEEEDDELQSIIDELLNEFE